MTVTRRRHHEVPKEQLTNLLVTARRRIGPADKPYLKRKVRRGDFWYRQSDVDAATGSKTNTYSRMEAGELSPTDDYLLALAEALLLTEEEWINLWLYVRGYRNPFPLTPLTTADISDAWKLTVDGQRHPCYLGMPYWRPYYWNDAALAIFGGKMPENILGRILLYPEARALMPDWETRWVPIALAQLRQARIEHPQLTILREIELAVRRDHFLKSLYDGDLSPTLHPDNSRRLIINATTGKLGLIWSSVGEVPSCQGARIITMIWTQLPDNVKADDPSTWPEY